METDDPLLVAIRVLYLGVTFGVMAFLLIWEGGRPRLEFGSTGKRWRHVFRNWSMLFWVIVIADHLVGQELMHAENYLLRPDGIILQASEWPISLQILLGFLASDLVGYLLHRAGHRIPWLWRLHSVHHSDPLLDVTTAGRSHPVELSLFVACKILLYQLLGLPMWIEGLRASLHNGITMIQHANVSYPAWIERLRLILVTPAMHRLHHDDRRMVHDSNYGMVFSFWDRVFGTYTDPDAVAPGRLGLRGYEDESWQTVRGMMLTPVRRPPIA